jgi:hypothetical protein
VGFHSRDDCTVPVTMDSVVIDPIVAKRAMHAVALRTEMGVEERYDILEMLGLVGSEEEMT